MISILIFFGWWVIYAPNAVITAAGPLGFRSTAAPEATLRQLVIALLAGSAFILPSLVFLIRVFKSESNRDVRINAEPKPR